jgi:hypothetical protein
VDWNLAAVIIAELGVDMKVFGSVSQLASPFRQVPITDRFSPGMVIAFAQEY